jgi:RHS repeat-associated protein
VLVSATTPSNAKVLNLTYNFNLGNGTTGSDNGNVIQIANGKDSNRSQNFLHDSLNRIQQAYTSGPNWGETFSPTATAPGVPPSTPGIDPWGNLTNRSGVTGKTLYEPLSAPALTSNRLTGFGYDAAGNMTSNGSASYVYDDENRLIAAAGMSYVYDGDGQRVEKCTEGATPGTCASSATGTFYFLQAGGGTLAESDLGGNWTATYGLVRGQIASRVDLPAKVVHYYFHDHLNSTNVITDNLGDVTEEEDFYPYGGEIVITSGDSNRHKFTGKERDSESGLDDFGERYYGSAFGRFLNIDPQSTDAKRQKDPQQLNMYGYARNNPLTYTDDGGEEVKEVIRIVTYPVHGTTAKEALANATQVSGFKSETGEGMMGETTSQIQVVNTGIDTSVTPGNELVDSFATAEVKSADVKLDQTITLPSWQEQGSAPAEEQKIFAGQVSSLKEHEDGHAEINRQQAQKLDKSLPGTRGTGQGKTPQEALNKATRNMSQKEKNKAQQVNRETADKQKEYDRKSGHGRKQHDNDD